MTRKIIEEYTIEYIIYSEYDSEFNPNPRTFYFTNYEEAVKFLNSINESNYNHWFPYKIRSREKVISRVEIE